MFDVDCLINPQEAITKAFDYWKSNLGFRDSEQSVNDFQNMIKTLMPTFNIVESVASTGQQVQVKQC